LGLFRGPAVRPAHHCRRLTLILRLSRRSGARQAALVVAENLVVNLIFFLTHPVFTSYYTIPVAMLSLWTLLFATLIPHRETIGDSLAFRQPVKA